MQRGRGHHTPFVLFIKGRKRIQLFNNKPGEKCFCEFGLCNPKQLHRSDYIARRYPLKGLLHQINAGGSIQEINRLPILKRKSGEYNQALKSSLLPKTSTPKSNKLSSLSNNSPSKAAKLLLCFL